ncbi:metallophosphoesterase [Psychroserpens sp. XS_ASV72]|uniref:metallophosphoesterase family protein n=1 Tax=Psychroserpens sp. XS_ASV72 TaxID=3241293 RepID=UPI0035185E89
MSEFNVCILSDIHFKKNYGEDHHPVKDVFKSFKKRFLELNDQYKFDCVIISGDLAFQGNSEEYTGLSEELNDIVPSSIPILSVVGNHDVYWDSLKSALGDSMELESLFKVQKSEFNSGRFDNVFMNFRDKFINKLKSTEEFEFKYNDERFMGYCYFEKKQVLVILINSSWYSFGPGIISKYYDLFVKKLGDNADIIKENLKDLLLGDKLSQMGKQSYFLETKSFPFWKEIQDILNKNPATRVISIAHHPPSWLNWDEQFKPSDIKNGTIRLDELFKLSNILITGHEHVPMNSQPVKLHNNCYNIQMGSFLDYHYIDNDENDTKSSKFPNNWFSVLTMGTYNCKLLNYQLTVEGNDFTGTDYFKWNKSKDLIEFNYREMRNDHFSEEEHPYLFVRGGFKNANKVLPSNLDELKDIVNIKRKNDLSFDNSMKGVEQEVLIECLINQEESLIVINGLTKYYSSMGKEDNIDKLLEIPFFNELDNYLNKSNVINLTFYDLIKVEYSYEYEDYYNIQFIRFIAFKHSFFNKFQKFYKHKELNINYDCLLINS